jgi:hypothetical protein
MVMVSSSLLLQPQKPEDEGDHDDPVKSRLLQAFGGKKIFRKGKKKECRDEVVQNHCNGIAHN